MTEVVGRDAVLSESERFRTTARNIEGLVGIV